MMARNISAFKKSEEELCELLKNLDEQELTIQKTNNEIAKLKKVNDSKDAAVGGPILACALGHFVVSLISVSTLISSRRLSTSNSVFGIGSLFVIGGSSSLSGYLSQNARAEEKGLGLAAIRIARLYKKVITIRTEIESLKTKVNLPEDEIRNLESTLKQLEIAANVFKEIADHYDKLEKKASGSVNGCIYNEHGLHSVTVSVPDQVRTLQISRNYTDTNGVVWRQNSTIPVVNSYKNETTYYQ